MQREVSTRYVSKDGTAGAERAYVFSHDGGDTGRTSHSWTVLDDPDGQSEKAWWFQTDSSQFHFGLVMAYEARSHHYPATAGARHDDYTWTMDAAGNPYVSAVLTTKDMGNPAQVQKNVSGAGRRAILTPPPFTSFSPSLSLSPHHRRTVLAIKGPLRRA